MKYTVDPLSSLVNQQSAVTKINDNLDAIATALENTLSRDGTMPNTMSADIDANSNDLLNINETHTAHLFLNGEEVFQFVGLLDDLHNVHLTGTTTGDLLRYDGSYWVNVPDTNYLSNDVPVVTFSDTDRATNDRVITDSADIIWDTSVSGQVSAKLVGSTGGGGGGTSDSNVDWRPNVDYVLGTNSTRSGEFTDSGFTSSSSRVLLIGQTDKTQNGVYTTSSGSWSRVADMDSSAAFNSGMVMLNSRNNVLYTLTTPNPITLGTTQLTFKVAANQYRPMVNVTRTATSGNYTLANGDGAVRLNFNESSPFTITIPQDTVWNFSANQDIHVVNHGAGQLSFALESGVTLENAYSSHSTAAHQTYWLKKKATNDWHVVFGPTDVSAFGTGDMLKSDNLSGLANYSTARSNLGLAIGSNVQAWDADLDAIAALSATSGYLKKTGTNTWVLDTSSLGTGTVTSVGITAPAAGITSSGGPITSSGSITLALANDLAALEGLSSTGYPKRTGTDTWTQKDASGIQDDISSTRGDLHYRGASAWSQLAIGASGYVLKSNGTDPTWAKNWSMIQASLGAGDGTTVITAGAKADIVIPFDCTIDQVTLLSDVSGSVVVDIYKTTYSSYDAGSTHPVSSDKITSSTPPTISSATKSQDSTLTGWTTSLSQGDVIRLQVTGSPASITRVTVAIRVVKG